MLLSKALRNFKMKRRHSSDKPTVNAPSAKVIKEDLKSTIRDLETTINDVDTACMSEISTVIISQIEELDTGKSLKTTAAFSLDHVTLSHLKQSRSHARYTSDMIKDLKEKLTTLRSKPNLTETETKTLKDMNDALIKNLKELDENSRVLRSLMTMLPKRPCLPTKPPFRFPR